MTTIEIIASIFGFLCVWLCVVRSVWTWPTGLVQVLLFIIVFYQAKLYADMILHVIYVGLQIFGWLAWQKSRRTNSNGESGADAIAVQSLSRLGIAMSVVTTVVLTAVFSILLKQFTDASLPIADSFVAAASLVAQFLLAKRYLENWGYWIVVDTVGIALFAYKELYPTAILYALFWFMAVVGLIRWYQALHGQLRPKTQLS